MRCSPRRVSNRRVVTWWRTRSRPEGLYESGAIDKPEVDAAERWRADVRPPIGPARWAGWTGPGQQLRAQERRERTARLEADAVAAAPGVMALRLQLAVRAKKALSLLAAA